MNNGPQAVFLFIALFVFVAIFYGPWQTLCVDWARQEMFESRNVLFRLAEDKRWSFHSAEYRKLRVYIETMIRFTHRASWPRLLFFMYLRRKMPPKSQNWGEILKQIPDAELRNDVELEVKKLVRALITLIIYRSVVFLIFAWVAFLTYKCVKPIREVMRTVVWFVYAWIEKDAQTMGPTGQ